MISTYMRTVISFCLLLFLVTPARAHVGSKDVFETVHAGPYTLYVTVRPPNVIPGVATVEVRVDGAAVSALKVTPLPVTGDASRHPPAADTMDRSTADPAFYTGAVWMMAAGTWQVRFDVDGAAGHQQASVPVVAVPLSVMTMDRGMGVVLALLGLFLVVTFAGMIAAAVRDARLPPGEQPTPALQRLGRIALVASLVFLLAAVFLGDKWWNAEAANYSENIYKPAPTRATLSGSQLDVLVSDIPVEQYKRAGRSNSDYLPDHGHLMHLYAIRQPGLDAAFHLHPEMVAPGDFRISLPAMPPGHYNLYGDVVHKTGLPETLVTSIDVPAGASTAPLASEDASAITTPVSAAPLGPSFKLPDGYTMVWDKPGSLASSQAYSFTFHLLAPDGKPATDMQPYLGMAGHAAFVKTDGTVFAHTHPEGSAAMADVMLANQSLDSPAMAMNPGPVAPVVSFPYGFPTPGRYRIFIQMKHASTVETGVFDAEVK